MGEKNLWAKIGLIVLIAGLSAWQIYPPDQKLKQGIDLGGGHSLLFEIDDTGVPDIQRSTLATDVMNILKQRIDPGSTRNLIWRPIGWNRLEIQMPQPSKKMDSYRTEFEKVRADLADTTITEAQIRAALALPPNRRQAAFDALVKGVSAREDLFAKLAQAEDEYRNLQSPPDSQPAGSQPTTRAVAPEIAARIDQAFLARRQAIEDLLKTNLDIRVLIDVLSLDPNSKIRAERLAGIENEHPELKSKIAAVVEKFNDWAKVRGALDDPADLMRLLRGAGELEFRILAQRDPSNPERTAATNPAYREDVKKYIDQLTKFGPRPLEGDNFAWFRISKPEENDIAQPRSPYIVAEYLGRKYVLSHATDDMGLLNKGDKAWQLRGAFQGMDRTGRPAVNFQLDPRGGKIFGELTRNNIERPLCIFLDDEAMSAATIRDEITTDGQISGNFSTADVARIINTLNAGVLPARLKETPLQVKSVGPSLGETNRNDGIRAVSLAFLVTILFMAVYYSYNGVVADIALLMNLVITLGVMSFIQATFTLPGIAGLVLTLGMAVDANVLIYERMREELDRGVTVRMAVRLGYERAFSAILDSNVTTIITAVILCSLGSEEIKGFGLTLGIGLATSLFTALFVTRQFFNVMTPPTLDRTETRRTWLGAVVLALIGGAFVGLGYVAHSSARAFEESALTGAGAFFLVMGATALALLIAMWVFRFIYRVSGHQRIGRLPMMRLMSAPTINWMGIYRKFWVFSAIIIGGGFVFMFSIDASQVLDIEFLGGTSVQFQVREDRASEFAERGDEKLADSIRGRNREEENQPSTTVGWLRLKADQFEKAKVTPKGEDRFVLTGYDADLKSSEIEAILQAGIGAYIVRGGVVSLPEGGVDVQFDPARVKKELHDEQGKPEALVRRAADYARAAAERFRNPRVQMVEEQVAGGEVRRAFEVIVTETQSGLVAEALRKSLGGFLKVSQPVDSILVKDPDRAPDGMYPVRPSDNTLADVIGGDVQTSVAEYKGGVALVFDKVAPPVPRSEIVQRIRDMRLQADFEDVGARALVDVIPLATSPQSVNPDDPLVEKFAFIASEPNLPYVEGEDNATWRSNVAERELALVRAALGSSRALDRVTQFAPQVAGEAVQAAVIAIIFSLIAIAVYLWIRFGSLDFGLCGIIALYHDVAITLACVMAAHFLYDNPVGRALLLADFKVDLTLIAALLTIIGFSINDTIVIFDRIRENRGRMPVISPKLINDSLNQTLSRTIITALTVFFTVVIMYVAGGEGIHGFAFAMLIGTISGSYSTLTIATPLLRHPRAMWVVTIVLAALTIAAVVNMVSHGMVQLILIAVIVVIGGWFLVRQWRATETGGLVQEAAA